MPALNFMKRFVPSVEAGDKTHSIRAERLRPWKVGDALALYTGMRSKACRLLFRTVVTKVEKIIIAIVPDMETGLILIDGYQLQPDELETFAKRDGFRDHADMMTFWQKTHALPFKGDIIHWKLAGKQAA